MAQRVMQGFGTFRICKGGQPAKKVTTEHKTLVQAEERKSALEKLNPGQVWVVLPMTIVASI